MAYTNTWNAAFEAAPADVDDVGDGASEIRKLILAIRERMQMDHYFDPAGTDIDHGEHKQITLHAPISTPGNVANKGFVYGKDVSSKIELHWEDEDGNELQLTSAGALVEAGGVDIPSGEIILFEKDTVVTGYTLQTDKGDMLIYITKGTGTPVSTGTTTSTVSDKLVDSTADFVTDGVAVGDLAKNTTDTTYAYVKEVEDLNTLVLETDIMATGETYSIYNADETPAAIDAPGTWVSGEHALSHAELPSVNLPSGGAHPHNIEVQGAAGGLSNRINTTAWANGNRQGISGMIPSGSAHVHALGGSNTPHSHDAHRPPGRYFTRQARA